VERLAEAVTRRSDIVYGTRALREVHANAALQVWLIAANPRTITFFLLLLLLLLPSFFFFSSPG